MADRVFIIPLRNDLAGVGLNLGDLRPNAGQRNSIYEGTPQNVYVAESLDPAGTTVVNGISYISGSLNTTLTADAVVADTTGGGNDCVATTTTTFGLAAYFKDRIHDNGDVDANGSQFAFGSCNWMNTNLLVRVMAGATLTEAQINIELDQVPPFTSNSLTAGGTNKSFGTVSDILRILSGEIYRLPANTIIGNAADQFLDLAARQALVAAQTPAMVAAQGQFYASGGFLEPGEPGYRSRPTLVPTGAFNISNGAGVIAGYKGNITLLRREFAYSAGAVTAWRPRAWAADGVTAIAATGIGPAIGVYNHLGVPL